METRRIVVGGLVASIVLAMWEMIVEAAIPDGAGFLGPPIAIGATVVRDLQGAANPLPFDGVALVLGLLGHMMNAVVLAAIFGVLVTRLSPSTGAGIGLGVAWGVLVFTAMWLIVLPVVDPLMLNVNGAAFLIGHVMWGATLSVLSIRIGAGRRTALAG